MLCRFGSADSLWNDLTDDELRSPVGYIREERPGQSQVQNDEHGQEFELERINFKRFLPSTEINLKTIANAQDALGRVAEAEGDVSDKLALVGALLVSAPSLRVWTNRLWKRKRRFPGSLIWTWRLPLPAWPS